mmetsp:Transcript_7731/g.25348  ORF Transcript_7731/g.25348 Transcript_7731/m.25348 type:complete len:484 (+) Transcript_7731:629-2080(+)
MRRPTRRKSSRPDQSTRSRHAAAIDIEAPPVALARCLFSARRMGGSTTIHTTLAPSSQHLHAALSNPGSRSYERHGGAHPLFTASPFTLDTSPVRPHTFASVAREPDRSHRAHSQPSRQRPRARPRGVARIPGRDEGCVIGTLGVLLRQQSFTRRNRTPLAATSRVRQKTGGGSDDDQGRDHEDRVPRGGGWGAGRGLGLGLHALGCGHVCSLRRLGLLSLLRNEPRLTRQGQPTPVARPVASVPRPRHRLLHSRARRRVLSRSTLLDCPPDRRCPQERMCLDRELSRRRPRVRLYGVRWNREALSAQLGRLVVQGEGDTLFADVHHNQRVHAFWRDEGHGVEVRDLLDPGLQAKVVFPPDGEVSGESSAIVVGKLEGLRSVARLLAVVQLGGGDGGARIGASDGAGALDDGYTLAASDVDDALAARNLGHVVYLVGRSSPARPRLQLLHRRVRREVDAHAAVFVPIGSNCGLGADHVDGAVV